ncbi:MAG TPA: magnesium transporter [Candidatus Anoxymicrobiaceae bacterium]|jgi:magnesium transporter
MDERNKVILDTVRDMLSRGDLQQAVTTVGDLHAADSAEVLSRLASEDEVEILVSLDVAFAARVLFEMEEPHQVEVAARLRTGELHELLERMPVDEAVDLLGDVPVAMRARLLKLFGREDAVELQELLAYEDDTAGGLMTTDYFAVSQDATAEETIEQLRGVSPEIETIYYVYVASQEGLLEGVLSLRELIISPPDRRVGDLVSRGVISVQPRQDQEEVAEVISKYDLLAVPVVDDKNKMLGIVTVDDVMDVFGDEAEEDIMRFAGATGLEEESRGGLFAGLGRRLPWFIAAVIVEVLVAGGLLKLYSPLFAKSLVLVFFIPLLVTMGGNIAVQSSTIMGRWLSAGTPLKRATLGAVTGEVAWGVMVGLFTGGVVAAIAFAFHQPASVGITVGLTLALTVIAAALVGCAFPVTLKAMHRDPGAISGPLLGTTMDVLSLAIYLAIGTLLIRI